MISEMLKDYPEVPVGWHELFNAMCKELLEYTKANGLPEVKVIEAKEKYGALRIYVGEEFSDEATDAIIRKWCEKSKSVCYFCGAANARTTKSGQIIPVCRNCWEKKLRRNPDAYAGETVGTGKQMS